MKFTQGYRRAFGSVEDGNASDVNTVDQQQQPEPGADVHGGSSSGGSDGSGAGAGDAGGNLPPEYQGDPIFLSATATASLNAIGVPNIDALRNPYNYVIEIHELRFLAVTQIMRSQFTAGGGQVGVYGGPGAQLGVSMSLGTDHLTRNYVPMNLICPGQPLNGESVQYGGTLYNLPAWIAGSYRVKLARPLAIMPGERLMVEFSHRGVLQNDITGTVGLLGRLTKRQKSSYASRVLPFFTAWTPQPLYQPSALPAAQQVSTETDLQNSTGAELEVLRFIGRVNAVGLYGLSIADSPPTKPHVPSSTQSVGALVATEFTDSPVGAVSTAFPQPDGLVVQMVKSTGVPVVAPGSPFRCVFDAATRSWELDDSLDPNGYYIAQVNLNPPSSSEAGSNLASSNPIYPAIGMYGQREVGL